MDALVDDRNTLRASVCFGRCSCLERLIYEGVAWWYSKVPHQAAAEEALPQQAEIPHASYVAQ